MLTMSNVFKTIRFFKTLKLPFLADTKRTIFSNFSQQQWQCCLFRIHTKGNSVRCLTSVSSSSFSPLSTIQQSYNNRLICPNSKSSCITSLSFLQKRTFTDKPDKDVKDQDLSEEEEKSLSIFQRFKRAYKQHGKVLIGVHLVTSTVWFSAFYTAAVYGFDIIPYLEQLGVSESILNKFKYSGVGDLAVAYLMYKVATPARYAVTLGGTNLVIRHYKKTGKINVSEEDSIKKLVAESREVVKEKRDSWKGRSENMRTGKIDQLLKAAREKREKHKSDTKS